MNKEDLMIGDWVDIRLQDDEHGEHMYSQVEQLLECEIDAYFKTSYANVYPIPLTKKILEANGFLEKEIPTFGNKEFYGNDILLRFWNNDYCHVHYYGTDKHYYFPNDVRYVHELQHILKICNIQIKITMPYDE